MISSGGTPIHPLARRGVIHIAPYRPGTPIEVVARQRGRDPADFIKLASNENPSGSAPNAIKAAQEALEGARYYPECGCVELTEVLGEKIEVAPQRIFFGNSSNELINYLIRAFLNQEENIVISQVTFPMYGIGAQYQTESLESVIRVPNREGRYHDIPAILRAITDKTKIVWIDSPNNPLGTIVTQGIFDEYFSLVPDHVITIIDEAYDQFADDPAYPDSRVYQSMFQAVVLRTFSKLYGLADLRIGYLIAEPSIVGTLHRVHAPFYLPSHHQAAMLAALKHDDAFIAKTLEVNRQGKEFLYAQLESLGVNYIPTQANFIFYPCEQPGVIYERFLDFGIIVRPITTIGIRVSIGLPEENARFIEALKVIHQEGLI